MTPPPDGRERGATPGTSPAGPERPRRHRLLERQLRRHFGGEPSLSPAWNALLDDVDRAYREADEERKLTERAFDLASNELLESNGALRERVDQEARLRKLEEVLRSTQKLEAIGKLAGGVAHDFNNLLTGLIGHAYNLSDALDANDPLLAEVREIERAAERAAALTRQLLAFSRRQVLTPTVIDLADVVAGMESFLRRLITERIQVVIERGDGTRRVRADRGQLEQVVMNLAINARDAMPGGGRLTLRCEEVVIDTGTALPLGTGISSPPQPGRYAVLDVADEGVGMSDEVRAHLFEPFFTTKEPGEGTGLGLATVYEIVTQSGGAITVETAPERGTRFRVYLPWVDSPPPPFAPEQRRALVAGTEPILVVEDELAVRVVVVRALRRAGYEVLEADGSEAACALARAYPGRIALLLTDVVMPGESGPRLARKLCAERPELRVLLMSGHADDELERADWVVSPGGFLAKPFTPAELCLRVREALDAPIAARDAAAP